MGLTLSEALGRRSHSGFSLACLAGLGLFIPAGWVSAWAWEKDLRWFYLFLIAFFISSLAVPLSIHLAVRFQVFDMPDPRKMHRAAMPRLGGMAIFLGTVLTLLRNLQWSAELAGLAAGGAIIYAMGVVEDARGLSARARLAGQLAAAALVVGSGVSVTFFPTGFPGERLWEGLFTIVWLVGITNAINFLDGIDGLAAGLGLVCSLIMISIAWPERQGHLCFAASALAGASLGFIPYNWHPARVFMGDAGATFIGFMLAGLAVMGSWANDDPLVALSTPILILGIPIFDMTYTTLARVRRGVVRTVKEWLEYTGKDHFHHRLIHLGMSVPEAVGFILLVNLCLGMAALVCRYTASGLGSVLLLFQTLLFFIVIVELMLLGRELTPEEGRSREGGAPRGLQG